MTVLRETGHLRIQLYRAHYAGTHAADKQLVYTNGSAGEQVTATNENATTDTNADEQAWGLGLDPTAREPEKPSSVVLAVGMEETYFTRVLREELSEAFKNKPSLQILIYQAKLSGAYWVPFLKQGTCSYKLALKEAGPSFVKTRTLSGDIKFNMDGLCSIRELKAELAEKIAKQAAGPSSDINK